MNRTRKGSPRTFKMETTGPKVPSRYLSGPTGSCHDNCKPTTTETKPKNPSPKRIPKPPAPNSVPRINKPPAVIPKFTTRNFKNNNVLKDQTLKKDEAIEPKKRDFKLKSVNSQAKTHNRPSSRTPRRRLSDICVPNKDMSLPSSRLPKRRLSEIIIHPNTDIASVSNKSTVRGSGINKNESRKDSKLPILNKKSTSVKTTVSTSRINAKVSPLRSYKSLPKQELKGSRKSKPVKPIEELVCEETVTVTESSNDVEISQSQSEIQKSLDCSSSSSEVKAMQDEQNEVLESSPPSVEDDTLAKDGQNVVVKSSPPPLEMEDNQHEGVKISTPSMEEDHNDLVVESSPPSLEDDRYEVVNISPPSMVDDQNEVAESSPPSLEDDQNEVVESFSSSLLEDDQHEVVKISPSDDQNEGVESSPPRLEDDQNEVVESSPPLLEDDQHEVVKISSSDDQNEVVESSPPSLEDDQNEVVESSPPSLEDDQNEVVESSLPSMVDDTLAKDGQQIDKISDSEVNDIKDTISVENLVVETSDCSLDDQRFRRGTVLSPESENNRLIKVQFKKGKELETETVEGEIISLRRLSSDGEVCISESVSVVVDLKHQEMEEKKDAVLGNNVIEETASKLIQTRKSKVKALVGAFETIVSSESPRTSDKQK